MGDKDIPIGGDWPAAVRARIQQPVKNALGVPYLNLADPVEFAADQAQRSAVSRFLSYDGVEAAVTAVSAWMSLADAQTQAELNSGEHSPAERELVRTLSKPIVYDIALRAACAAFRVGVEHGMEINAPLDELPPARNPRRTHPKTEKSILTRRRT